MLSEQKLYRTRPGRCWSRLTSYQAILSV